VAACDITPPQPATPAVTGHPFIAAMKAAIKVCGITEGYAVRSQHVAACTAMRQHRRCRCFLPTVLARKQTAVRRTGGGRPSRLFPANTWQRNAEGGFAAKLAGNRPECIPTAFNAPGALN